MKVVISFEHTSKARAIWLARQLRDAGHESTIEDDFGAESPRREMAMAIERCDVVVAVVTPAFIYSVATQRELDLAEAHGKPVVAAFAGLPSRDPRARAYAAYRRVELMQTWRGTADQWHEMLGLLLRLLEEQERRLTVRHVIDRRSALRAERAFLLYDIEDRALAFRLLRARPGWMPSGAESEGDEAIPRVLLWTRASAERHSLVARDVDGAPSRAPDFLIRTTDAPTPPFDTLAIPVDQIIDVTPRRTGAQTLTEDAARAEIGQLLDEVRLKNQGVPLDVFTERFCGSYESAGAAQDAFELATARLSPGDALRLRAVREHVLALRFYGDWRQAVTLAATELQETPEVLAEVAEHERLRLELEQLNLEYELGDQYVTADEAEQRVRALQWRFRELTDLQGYVQASRVLGNITREQGNFDDAERILQRTIGVAEYLAEHSHAGGPGELLLSDCHRELAGLYIARRDDVRARNCLADARDLLEVGSGLENTAALYLCAALDYVDATLARPDEVLIKATTPTEQAQLALAILARFGNPIRTAAVYDWLGQAWARQIPQRSNDMARAEEYLRKALRIRQNHGHTYTCGLSHLSLGKLYEVIGDLSGEISHYEMSVTIFAELGVQPALARAHAALARAFFRKSLAGDTAARDLYREHLDAAETLYRDIQLESEGIELRYELEHGGRRPVDEVSEDTPLVAVGEYLLHRWIREHVSAQRLAPDLQFALTVGIGDDAAVMTPTGVEPDYGLVFTTDSAPGSLSRLSASPEYAGRFAVVQTLTDILAMGARPVGLLVNVFLSRAATVGYVKRLIEAVVREAARYGVAVVGGDVKERDEQSVGCVGIGCVPTSGILTRSAARTGQALCMTLASDPAGPGSRLIGTRWAHELVEHYRMTSPDVLREFPVLAEFAESDLKYDLLCAPTAVTAAATSTGRLCAAMDTSDGLLACLEIIGRDSDVGFELDEAAINRLIDPRARHLADILELPAVTFLFSAGHDWEIVFTCAQEDYPAVADKVAADLQGHGSIARLGTVVPRAADSAAGVTLRRVDGSLEQVPYYTDEKFVPRRYQDRPAQWLGFADRLRQIDGYPLAVQPEDRPG